ncbi:MAG: phage minor capsid protein [Lachnospiraceae bacterium]
MLTEEQLEIISEAIQPLFQYLEKEVIADIARRIQKTLTYSRTAELQAKSMADLGYSPTRIRKEAMKLLNADPDFRKAVAKNTLEYKREVRKIINDITKEAYKANDEIVAGAGDMAWVDDLSVWRSAGKKLTEKSFLSQLVEAFTAQTAGELENMTQSTGFKTMSGYEGIENAYKRELDKAVIKICSGTFSQEKVLRDVVHDLSQSGLRSIDFASGYSMQLDTAARLALRTGCHQLAGKILDKNIEQTGENLVYVSKHWGARNTGVGHANHEQWQGRVYYIKEGKDYREEAKRIGQDYITDLWRATGYSVDGTHESDPAGLYGYNCCHNHHVWFEGASSIPKEQPQPGPFTVNGKTYDYYAATQKMRTMERNIRALKREKEALKSLGADTTEIKAKIKGKTAEYKEFCNACGVPATTTKLRYECGTSDLKKTRAWNGFEVSVVSVKDAANIEKIKSLGASDGIGDINEPICIGQIDPEKREQAVEYFGEQIRKSETEKLYIIDKQGNVYYNEGINDAVGIGSLDLTDCIVLHNHPISNGIVSFGETDFSLMKEFQTASYRLVNEEYDYSLNIIKPIDNLSYNQLWLGALELVDITKPEDYQHIVMEYLRREGYVDYVRKKANKRAGN